MPKIPALLFFCLLSLPVFAQDDPGIWAGGGLYIPGNTIGDALKSFAGEKKIVIQVNNNGNITGTLDVTYNKTLKPSDAVDASFIIGGKYDSITHKLVLVVTHLKAANSASADIKFKYPDTLRYSVTVTQRQGIVGMTGAADIQTQGFAAEWIKSTKLHMQAIPNSKMDLHILPLNILLEKFVPFAETTAATTPPPVKKDPVSVQTPPPVVKSEPAPVQVQIDKRKTEIQSTILLDTSLIKLDLYDNGEVDGDIATLILDGNVIINNQLLSTKAASVTINLSNDKLEHLLELYAINEGSIPPNAALVVLTCNRKRYEINLSSNGTKNGSVKLVLPKK